MKKSFLFLCLMSCIFQANAQKLDTALMVLKTKVCILEYIEPQSILKGFRDNDFNLFFLDAYSASNVDYSIAAMEDLSSFKKFTDTFYIEGLDLKCLYKNLKKNKKQPECLWPARKLVD